MEARRLRQVAAAVGTGLVTAVVLLGIFTVARSDKGAGVAQDHWVWRTPDPTGMIQYADLITRPAPTTAAAPPRVAKEQALAIAQSLGFDGLAPGEPRVSLQMATRRFSAESADGFEDRLSWIVVYPNSPILLFGPPGVPAEARRQMEESSACDFVIALDADTGDLLTSLQSCRKKP